MFTYLFMCTWGPIIALGVNIFGKIFSLFLFFCEKPLIQQSSNRAWPKGKGSKTVLIVDYPPHSLDCLSSHTYLCFYPISFLFVSFCWLFFVYFQTFPWSSLCPHLHCFWTLSVCYLLMTTFFRFPWCHQKPSCFWPNKKLWHAVSENIRDARRRENVELIHCWCQDIIICYLASDDWSNSKWTQKVI